VSEGHLSAQTSTLFFQKAETVPQTHLELLRVINYSRVMQYKQSHIKTHQAPHWFSARSQKADDRFHLCLQMHKNESMQTHIRSFCEVTLTEKKKWLVVLKPHLITYIKYRKLSQGYLDSILKTVVTDFPLTSASPARREQWLSKC